PVPRRTDGGAHVDQPRAGVDGLEVQAALDHRRRVTTGDALLEDDLGLRRLAEALTDESRHVGSAVSEAIRIVERARAPCQRPEAGSDDHAYMGHEGDGRRPSPERTMCS